MRFKFCGRARELTELLDHGHWPAAASDELQVHVAHCRICRDHTLVREAFRTDRKVAAGTARLEAPGVLWWRAQLRRRNQAIERLAKPILGAEVFAVVLGVLMPILYLAVRARRGFASFGGLQELPRAFHFEALLPDSLGSYQSGTWLWIGAVALGILMSGVIVYIASEKR